MLENYYEEIARKRHERGMFWFIVWALSIFLYLFFQGYYPYVKFDMGKFFETAEQRPSDLPENKPQVVRAFGIINVRTVPAPDRILISSSTIGEKSIPNDDKGFFDFGSYAVKIEKEGYVPVTLSTVLDKENSFSISVLELFKRPVYAPFIIPANLTEDLGGGKLLVRERTSTGEALTGGTLSGSVYRLVDSKDFSVTSSFRTDAKYLGGTLFEKHGAILSYDEDLGLVPAKMKTSSGETVLTLCEDALLEAGKVVCPKNGNVLFPHETTLKDRLLGASGRAIRMEKETVRVEGGRQISSEPVVTATGSKPGNVVRLAKTQYRLS